MSKARKQGLEYIRQTYNVPAYIGVRVDVDGVAGVIVGSGENGRLKIRPDGESTMLTYWAHPICRVTYHVVGYDAPFVPRDGAEAET